MDSSFVVLKVLELLENALSGCVVVKVLEAAVDFSFVGLLELTSAGVVFVNVSQHPLASLFLASWSKCFGLNSELDWYSEYAAFVVAA